VPVPRVSAVREVGRDGWWLLPDVWRAAALGSDQAMVEVPPEVYLRQFRDTDAADLDALARLCQLGLMVPVGPRNYTDLPVKDHGGGWARALADLQIRLWPDQPPWYGDEAEREAVHQRHLTEGVELVHAAEVALRVRIVQRATDHLLAHLAGEPVAPAWRDCTDDLDAWRNFVLFTGAALGDFQVRVDVEIVGHPRPPGDLELGEVYTTLYSAAMLQLVNDLAAGEIIHTCANETCGRRFVRQLGRSAYGGHRRSGTLYCTNTCARAQYQREKRRRDRVAKGGTTP
jgi:hypothetical protein